MQHDLRSVGTDSEIYKLAFHCPRKVHKAEFGQESLAIICHSDQDTHFLRRLKCTHPDCKTAIDSFLKSYSMPSISTRAPITY